MAETQATLPKWAKAKVEMVDSKFIFELLDEYKECDLEKIASDLLSKTKSMKIDSPEIHLTHMISAIMNMTDTPELNIKLSPRIVLNGFSRSAKIEDFSGDGLQVIKKIIPHVNNNSIKGRLSHLAWIIERKNKDMGNLSLKTKLKEIEEITKNIKNSKNKNNFYNEKIVFQLIKVTYKISRALGYPTEEYQKICDYSKMYLTICKNNKNAPGTLFLFSEFILDSRLIDPKEVAVTIDKFTDEYFKIEEGGIREIHVRLSKLAAKAWKNAKQNDRYTEAILKTVNLFDKLADESLNRGGKAFLASKWLEDAFELMHGVPNMGHARSLIKAKLADVQKRIPDEFPFISNSIDVSDLTESTRSRVSGLDLYEALKTFCFLGGDPPTNSELLESAKAEVQKFPFSSLFGTVKLDHEGKTVAKAPPIGLGVSNPKSEETWHFIMRHESTRRGLVAQVVLWEAKVVLLSEHFVAESVIHRLVSFSPVVSKSQNIIVARGLHGWLHGDCVAALFILTPMLEGIIRNLLIMSDCDISKIDSKHQTQENKSLGTLFADYRENLEQIFGGSGFLDDLERTFLDRFGPRLRNGVAHAFHPDSVAFGGDAEYGCWLIWRLVCWPLLPHWHLIFIDAEEGASKS